MNTALSLYLDDALNLYEVDPPFTIQDRLGGAVYLFDTEFIVLIREAFTTECVIKFNETQKLLLDNYMAYASGSITATAELIALDKVMVSLVTCESLPSADDCTVDSVHSYTPCP